MQRLCAAALSAVRPALAGSADVLRPSLAAGAARALRTSTGASTSQADLETTPLAREKGQALPPWTPTQLLQKRKTYMKRAGFMLSVLEQEKVEALNKERKIPEFGPGSVVELKLVRRMFRELSMGIWKGSDEGVCGRHLHTQRRLRCFPTIIVCHSHGQLTHRLRHPRRASRRTSGV